MSVPPEMPLSSGSLFAVRMTCAAAVLISVLSAGRASAESDFDLWYVDSTGIQIAVAWQPVDDASAYVLERDTTSALDSPARISFDLDSSITAFGDSGWNAGDSRRFMIPSTAINSPTYHLEAGTDYYYRVRAVTPSGWQESNIIGPHRIAVPANPSEIPRGEVGDLWADVVLGQPGFGENAWWKTDPFHIQSPGGVLVDRYSSHPTHVFLVDGNRNRILGMASLGRCTISDAPCSIDADCDGTQCVLTPGEVAPEFVLGQPSDTDAGACNGDSTTQLYPRRASPDENSLCLLGPSAISVAESVVSLQLAVDPDHNLYVPDPWNNRILMYRDPFDPANGTAAAEVWGQPDMTSGIAVHGQRCSGASSMSDLCMPNSVDVDSNGDLWVSDLLHNRVLRFPYDSNRGTAAGTADLALTGIHEPQSVRVDAMGNVFVATHQEVRKYQDPQIGSSNTPEFLDFLADDPDFSWIFQLAVDPISPDTLWAQISGSTAVRANTASGVIDKRIHAALSFGIDVSPQGDVFWTEAASYTAGLYRLANDESPFVSGAGPIAFLGWGVQSAEAMGPVTGITTAGNQLLVSDRYTVYFWNDYRSLSFGGGGNIPPDGVWGSTPAVTSGFNYGIRSDSGGRIWLRGSYFNGWSLFQSPLSATSSPLKTIAAPLHYKADDGSIQPLPDGTFGNVGSFAPIGSGDRVWVEDVGRSRVVRVVNIDGGEDPTAPPYIDIVLGQDSFAANLCNKGRGAFGFARDTLCAENAISLDSDGNLYVMDNATGGMDGGWSRLLRWDAVSIPDHPASTVFGILPDRIFGAGGIFTEPSPGGSGHPYPANDPAFPPRSQSHSSNGMLLMGGANPYAGPRLPMVYLAPDQVDIPQLAFGDYVSFPSASHVDNEGNVYLADYDWHRVLMYRQPLARLSSPPQTPAATPTATATPTPTNTLPAQDYASQILADGASPYYRFNETSGSTVFDVSPAGINAHHEDASRVLQEQPSLLPWHSDASTLIWGAGVTLPPTAASDNETIEGWFRPRNEIHANALVVRVDQDGNWQRMLWITGAFPELNRFAYTFYAGSTQYNVVGTTTVQRDRTYHVAVTLERNGPTSTASLFVNGIQEASLDFPGQAVAGDKWQIGLHGGGGLRNLTGFVDEIALYNVALPANRLIAHFNAGGPIPTAIATSTPTNTSTAPTRTSTPTPTASATGTHTPTATGTPPTATPTAVSSYSESVRADGATAYYRLAESNGPIAFDASGFMRDGTYVTGASLTFQQPGLLPGDSDPAILVEHSGVLVPDNTSPSDETIEGWFRPTANVDAKALIVRVDNTGSWTRMLWISGSWPALNRFTYSFVANGAQYDLVGQTTVVPNATYHVAVTRKTLAGTSEVTLYVNGVEEGSLTAPGVPPDARRWQIGLHGGGGLADFAGVIDDVALYDTALDASLLAEHVAIASGHPSSTPTVTGTASPTPTVTGTASPTPTVTRTASPTASATDTPTATPEPTVFCGDGTIQDFECCDMGASNGTGGNSCTNDCRCTGICTSDGAACVISDSCAPSGSCCGNGVLEPGEDCDDGNLADGDCCSSLCTYEPDESCNPQCLCAGVLGPHFITADDIKRTKLRDKSPPRDGFILDAFDSQGEFQLGSGGNIDPSSEPVTFEISQNDGSGGCRILYSARLSPVECSDESCFRTRTDRSGIQTDWRYRTGRNDPPVAGAEGLSSLRITRDRKQPLRMKFKLKGSAAMVLPPQAISSVRRIRQSLLFGDEATGFECVTRELDCVRNNNATTFRCEPAHCGNGNADRGERCGENGMAACRDGRVCDTCSCLAE